MTAPPRSFPKRRVELLLYGFGLACAAAYGLAVLLGIVDSESTRSGLVMFLAAPFLGGLGLFVMLRALRPSPYLRLDKDGFSVNGLLRSDSSCWYLVSCPRLKNPEPSFLDPFRFDAIVAEDEREPGRLYRFSAWQMAMTPAAALDLLTRYWRCGRLGEAWEAP